MNHIEKLPTGIPGFDDVAKGGLPLRRTSLLAGTAGSAKTVFATQFLVEGIRRHGQGGVFVTFEESPDDLRRNMSGFGWDLEKFEAEGRWAFVDASPQIAEERVEAGSFDFGALLARIEGAVRRVKAQRVVLDSVGAIFTQFADRSEIRAELYRVAGSLKNLGVTSIITAEREQEYGDTTGYGVEQFVADNVMVLRNVLDGEKRRRTVEILKFRGTDHQKGEYPFSVSRLGGVTVIPLSAIELTQKSSMKRIHSGSVDLDEMCGGGFFRDSVILVSGATGTGKTLMVSAFLAAGISQGERCVVFAFEESREQLFRNAIGWGYDFEKMEKEGRLKLVCAYPESASVEDHLISMKAVIDEFKPNRVAVDSLTALERVGAEKTFREFVISLTSYIKHKEVAGLFTSTAPALMGGNSVTEGHISTITDSIILLRYVEMHGEMRRGLTVLKMRGSRHDKDIREFTIDSSGMHIGKAFRNIAGILSGNLSQIAPREEVERLGAMFKEQP